MTERTVIWMWIEDGVLYADVPDGGLVGAELRGPWESSSAAANYIRGTVNDVLILSESMSPIRLRALYIQYDSPVDLVLVLTGDQAMGISHSQEYRTCLQISPDALSEFSDWRLEMPNNPNLRWGMAKSLYGLEVIVEEDDPWVASIAKSDRTEWTCRRRIWCM